MPWKKVTPSRGGRILGICATAFNRLLKTLSFSSACQYQEAIMASVIAVDWKSETIQRRHGFWIAATLSLGVHVSVAALLAGIGSVGKTMLPITVCLADKAEMTRGAVFHPAGIRTRGRHSHSLALASVRQSGNAAALVPPAEPSAMSVPTGEPAGLSQNGPRGTTGVGSQYLAQNFDAVRNRIRACLKYPHLAQKLGWQGEAIVSFVIRPDGYGAEIMLVHSCGHVLLDQNIVQAIRAAEPFPRPTETVRLILPVAYALEADGRH
jgi:TonB family protein